MSVERQSHWERVYSTNAEDQVSWFEAVPETSLSLIRACQLPSEALILDVGAGASHLPDALLREGFTNVAVLDVSAGALERTKARLGPLARKVRMIAADIVDWRPDFQVDLWHDRATLHFLREPGERAAYADTVRSAVKPGGFVIISGFAPSGPERCSGLVVQRASQSEIAALLGPEFELLDAFEKDHTTPKGADQRFLYTRWRRRAG